MKVSKEEKENRAKRFNISLATYYNWEKNKPELIKIIELGIEKEKEVELNIDNENKEDIYSTIEKMQKQLNDLEKEVRK